MNLLTRLFKITQAAIGQALPRKGGRARELEGRDISKRTRGAGWADLGAIAPIGGGFGEANAIKEAVTLGAGWGSFCWNTIGDSRSC